MAKHIEETIKTIVGEVIRDYGLTIWSGLTKDSKFGIDLGMDELDLNEVINRVEVAFEIGLSDNIVTLDSEVGDLVNQVRIKRSMLDGWSSFPTEDE